MYGFMYVELERYIVTHVGPEAWQSTCRRATGGRSVFSPTEQYDDADFLALVKTVSRLTNVELPGLLEDFGAFLVPSLIAAHAEHVLPEGNALDLLANAEQHVLTTRLIDAGTTPSPVRAERISDREVRIHYASERRMCCLARGLARGVMVHYREIGSVKETACMHEGAPACIIQVKRLAG
jgi:hypothetical protein